MIIRMLISFVGLSMAVAAVMSAERSAAATEKFGTLSGRFLYDGDDCLRDTDSNQPINPADWEQLRTQNCQHSAKGA